MFTTYPIRLHHTLFCFLTLLLMALGSIRAQAQVTLWLDPAQSTASTGDTLNFNLNLTGGTNLVGVGTQIVIDTSVLQFVPTSGTTGFTVPTNSPFQTVFENTIQNAAGNPTASGNILFVSVAASPQSTGGVDTPNTTTLGSFQVKLLKDLGASGTDITLSSIGLDVTQSQALDTNGSNLLSAIHGAHITSAPGPESWLVFGGGQGAFLWLLRRRRVRQARQA